MTTLSRLGTRLGTLCLLASTCFWACGARTGLPVGEGPRAADAGEHDGCTQHDIMVLAPVPNLYFVLDRSASMKEMGKWDTVRSVVANLMTTLGPRARFGAALFPDPNGGDGCAPGAPVMSLRLGDYQGTAAAALLAATQPPPSGGTPTAATLELLEPTLASFPGPTFAILATDGGPNCDPFLSCTIDQCTANLDMAGMGACEPNVPPNCCDPSQAAGPAGCLDSQNTIDAVARLASAGVPTFVIGIPGSAPYEQLLDQLAETGGTARSAAPYYYQVDTADSQALEAALAQIAARTTATCTLTLATAPSHPGDVNLVLDGVPVPPDPVNGWSLQGTTLTLLGATCQRVLSGQALDVQVMEGCPTVTQ